MRFKLKPLILLTILSLFSSCVNNADFNQINLDIEPVMNVPLVYFELDQLDFFDIDTNTEIEFRTDVTDFDVFQSSTIRSNLYRFVLEYTIEKDFDDRGITFFVDFLDVNDNITFSFDPIALNPGVNELIEAEILDADLNPQIFNTTKARVTVRLGPGSAPLDPDEERFIKFRSTGLFYLRI